MPEPGRHIIQRHYLHVEVDGTESEGLALQQRLPDLCQHMLIPAIEQALDRCAPAHGHLCFERLEIDAGTLTMDRFEHELTASVASELVRSIRGYLGSESSSTPISGDVQYKTAQHSVNEAFIYFLETGRLPWSFHLPAGSTLEQLILNSWLEGGVKPHEITGSVLRSLASSIVRKRLIRQFSPLFLETLLSLLSPEGRIELDGILHTLTSSLAQSVDTKQFRQLLWERIFACLASGNIPPARDIVAEAWKIISATTKGHAALADLLERHWPGSTGQASTAVKRTRGDEMEQPDFVEAIQLPESETTKLNRNRRMEAGEHIDEGEGFYIGNAGLVLLHPFFPQLFSAVGIAAEDKLLQPERALCLLHYLTTGQPIAPEYELTLPKILCNIHLDAPAESNVALTAAELEEADAVLNAAIRHWETLRNTSPDALRGTFLLRPGKLSLRDGDWLLQVEYKSCDILLDQLPWGISMIKLPWMEKMLWVEWK